MRAMVTPIFTCVSVLYFEFIYFCSVPGRSGFFPSAWRSPSLPHLYSIFVVNLFQSPFFSVCLEQKRSCSNESQCNVARDENALRDTARLPHRVLVGKPCVTFAACFFHAHASPSPHRVHAVEHACHATTTNHKQNKLDCLNSLNLKLNKHSKLHYINFHVKFGI